jgi:hypothetical protein
MNPNHTIPQPPRPQNRPSLWDKTWRNRQGHVVIWQMPNIPLIAWAVLTFLALIFNGGWIADTLSWLGSAALIIWCLLEIFKGANYFRRALGLLVLVYAIAALIQSL